MNSNYRNCYLELLNRYCRKIRRSLTGMDLITGMDLNITGTDL